MTPLDYLRLSFAALDENLGHAIGFALVPVLVGDLRPQRTWSERDLIKAVEARLAPSQYTPRAVDKVVSATASGEVLSVDARVRRTGSQSTRDKRSDHLEKALTQTVAEASALIEQSRREVERSRGLLSNEPRSEDGAPAPV